MKSRFATWVASLLVLGVFDRAEAVETRPNVLVIIADDWSYPHAGVFGDKTVKTPNIDKLASRGATFTNAYCASPSCTPSRGALLTGRPIHQLESGGSLWSYLPIRYVSYPDVLAAAGYRTGHSGKGWSPGTLDGSGRTHNPAGPAYRSFSEFLAALPPDVPFCYWHGSVDPHRPYDKGSGKRSGMKPESVVVPPYFPDVPEMREDILDYYYEVQRFDSLIGELLDRLEASGRASNTMVIVTSDNGMPFPRCKANLYDSGTRMPLIVRHPDRIKTPRTIDAFVSHVDLAPTILEAAGVKPEAGHVGKSLTALLDTGRDPSHPRDAAFVERERHANVREGDLSYPSRAIRTRTHLYIRNYRPDRMPAGDAETYHSVGPFGDVDGSPSKEYFLARRNDPGFAAFAQRALEKRPAEELYDLRSDPHQLTNLAARPEVAAELAALRVRLTDWQVQTGDPRAISDDDRWDRYPYVGAPAPEARRPAPSRATRTPDNALTDLEKRAGWILLFDGETLDGWRTSGGAPSKTPVDRGAINPHKSGGYMMIHEVPRSDFALSLDFQITPKCNSGIFIRTFPLAPRPGKDVGFNGIEIAIDDTTAAGHHDTGAIYDLVKPVKNAMKPVGEWNHAVILCDGPRIEVEINGELVTRMNLDEWPEPNKRPDGSTHKFDVAYKNHPRTGYLGLQDHGSPCRYKNVKLLDLSAISR